MMDGLPTTTTTTTSHGRRNLEQLAYYGPVTALEFAPGNASRLLLAGRGSELSIYDYSSSQALISSVEVFQRSMIHGIVVAPVHAKSKTCSESKEQAVNNFRVLVFGAYSFATVVLAGDGTVVSQSSEYVVQDWIYAGHWHGRHAYLVTAHSKVLQVDPVAESIDRVYACGSECILYSATIWSATVAGDDNGEDNDEASIVIAGGTVFGEILIWRLGQSHILHTLVGHEGSIFYLQFSPDGKRVASCSDDRCIKVWKIDNENDEAACTSTGWGHLARIWQLRWVSSDRLISCSEDNTTKEWHIQEHDGKMTYGQAFEGHSSRSIWSLAFKSDTGVFASGGADGRVRLWDLNAQQRRKQLVLSFDSITNAIGDNHNVKIKQYCTLAGGRVIAFSTIQGRVVAFDTTAEHSGTWSDVFAHEALQGYSILRGWSRTTIVVVADRFGTVYVVDAARKDDRPLIISGGQAHGKPVELVVAQDDDTGGLHVVVEFANPAAPWLAYEIEIASDGTLVLQASRALLPPATFTLATVFVNRGLLLTGSKHGALAAHNLVDRAVAATTGEATASHGVLRRVISDDTVTAIVLKERLDNSNHGGVLVGVVSRGGGYAIVKAAASTETGEFEVLHQNKISRGSIEGAAYFGQDLVVWGFKNKYFFAWNETKQYEVMSETCGGPHRLWQFSMQAVNDYVFAYTRASAVCVVRAGLTKEDVPFGLVQDGGHGREIRAIAVSPVKFPDGSILVATGSEDTCVRLTKVSANDGRLQTIMVSSRHVSGIQAAQWSPDGTYLFTTAAREELVAWRVTTSVSGPGAGIYCRPVADAPLSSGAAAADLRVMDITVRNVTTAAGDDGQELGPSVIVAAVYSDSTIKIWQFCLSRHEFKLAAETRYKTCCLFTAEFVDVPNHGQRSSWRLLVGSSDGYLTAYDVELCSGDDITATFAQAWTSRVHQSSIRALTTTTTTTTTGGDIGIAVTGGDDNSLCGTHLASGESAWRVASAHAATVTAVMEASAGVVISAGVDQRLRTWDVSTGTVATLIAETYTTVADTGSLAAAAATNLVLVGGAGLAIIRRTT
ncbi:WD40-repeat-containing domain protein [Lipomyces japonicus]|uniref:WD40-repeat-containing domain protein n=1 Tax=Lipomyces japonicus TaxID=56871 RepID=UPI0034CF8869